MLLPHEAAHTLFQGLLQAMPWLMCIEYGAAALLLTAHGHLHTCEAYMQVRAHNARLIMRAYSSIEPSKAAALLGLSETQATESAAPLTKLLSIAPSAFPMINSSMIGIVKPWKGLSCCCPAFVDFGVCMVARGEHAWAPLHMLVVCQ